MIFAVVTWVVADGTGERNRVTMETVWSGSEPDGAAQPQGARQEGREEGDRKARNELAKNFLEMGLTVEQVVQGTGLSREEVEDIRGEMLDRD
ncbi:MAG: hypothetical protein K6T83_09275 [Alicyclobacillus sp.]|nr:hypothetical protein [Alicyclobacillus sp.]